MQRFLSLGFSDHESRMLADAYDAVTKSDMWEYLRLPTTPGKEGFMFCHDIELAAIASEMKYQGHSGASYAWTLRQMEAIAKGGWESYASRIRMVKAPKHEDAMERIRSERVGIHSQSSLSS
jgi:hypothetical protein